MRVILLAALAVAAATWNLVRHWSSLPPPMRVPAPPAGAPTVDSEAGELPVPDILEPDGT